MLKRLCSLSCIILVVFGLFTNIISRQRYKDTHTNNDTLISTFSGGASGEWLKIAGDSIYDTIIKGSRKLGTKCINANPMSIDKILTPHVDMSGAYGFEINVTSLTPLNDSVFFLYLSNNNYQYNASFGFRVDYRAAYNYPDSNRYLVYSIFYLSKSNPNFSFSNIDKVRVRFFGKKGVTTYNIFNSFKVLRSTQTKGSLIFTFDGGYRTWYSNVLPKFKSAGMHGSFGITPYFIENGDTNDFLRIREIDSLSKYGNDVISHSYNHPRFDSISVDSCVYEINQSNKYLDSVVNRKKGAKSLFIIPYGFSSYQNYVAMNRLVSVNRSTDIFGSRFMTVPVNNQNWLTTRLADSTLATNIFTGYVDTCIKYKIPYCFSTHGIQDGRTGSVDFWQKTKFDSLVDYAKTKIDAGLLEVKSLSEYFTYAPDSLVIEKSRDTTYTTYTLNDSLSIDADTAKAILYDSNNGVWTKIDSTEYITGGSLFSLGRTDLQSNNTYYYRVIVRNLNGTYDSTFTTDSIHTLYSNDSIIGDNITLATGGTIDKLIYCKYLHVTTSDSIIFTKKILVRDSITFDGICKVRYTPGSYVNGFIYPPNKLYIRTNRVANIPPVLKASYKTWYIWR